MSGVTSTGAVSAYTDYVSNYLASKKNAQTAKSTDTKETNAAEKTTTEKTQTKKTSAADTANYGKTIGTPQLSEKAAKYYEQLKAKYGNYDFILVSEDEKANAQANAAQYANSYKTVVLIDEEKIERMATDENFRKQYEAILSGASSQLETLKNSMMSSGASVQGYGMQVNDGGTASFFAVLKKSSAAQKERIAEKAAEKKAEKKAAEKKAAKEAKEERIEEARAEKADDAKADEDAPIDAEDTVTITANSIEELMRKISDYTFTELSDSVMTESETYVGQTIDWKG